MHIAIIGNGIAGITAARHLRKQDASCQITVISAETEHFFSRTALMYIYMGHLKYEHTKPYPDSFWKKNRIALLKKYVKSIDFDGKSLSFSEGDTLLYDKLILACGSKPNKFGWPGQEAKGVQGLYSYQDLEQMEEASPSIQRAVIVGGGLIGVEMAEMFHSRHIPVAFLVREKRFWGSILPKGEGELVSRHILEQGIDLRMGEELAEILADKQGNVRAILTKSGEEIACQFVGLTAGVSPNVAFLNDTKLEIDKGILVDSHLQTNINDVYAIGDCAQLRQPAEGRRALEQVWYTGRMMGETVASTILGNPTPYKPGIWFNSAKFFDIEYQTYGTVLANNPEGVQSLYWEDAQGKKCIHITYRQASYQVVGVNVFGIRHRHEVWDKWIREAATLQYVLEHLAQANFDPEFFKTYEHEIVAVYNQQYPANPVQHLRKKRLLDWLWG